ncbi:predicted protein [Plenodomus lingam JN3]|uniref:Predicted protein n=1 Tax=Leptosphaeria maculans (strain JN3 / isolate v23.1.3 / race Av1-4-5-6-7-8) TaxID=985895 RepID=E4ZK69_LEPMJ|nr:predicted protein [Plenodomus lingam JN3]CBX91664.1 predicted protein [Plenodomus lingam JN3]
MIDLDAERLSNTVMITRISLIFRDKPLDLVSALIRVPLGGSASTQKSIIIKDK